MKGLDNMVGMVVGRIGFGWGDFFSCGATSSPFAPFSFLRRGQEERITITPSNTISE
jgi:hypothetical protein